MRVPPTRFFLPLFRGGDKLPSHTMIGQPTLSTRMRVSPENVSRRSFIKTGATITGALLAESGDAAQRDWSGREPMRYPDPDIVVVDPRFAKYKIGNTPLQRLWTGALWVEGCAWHTGGQYLVWSDIPNHRQMRQRFRKVGWISDIFREAEFFQCRCLVDWRLLDGGRDRQTIALPRSPSPPCCVGEFAENSIPKALTPLGRFTRWRTTNPRAALVPEPNPDCAPVL
jgi:hypothetical protein